MHTIIVVAAFLALGVFVNQEYLTKRPHAVQPVAPSNDEIYTGSILFTPPEGRICHQFLFDNRTGRFTDKGNVDCELAEGIRAEHYSIPRIWAISRGFK
ncbi:MAG TPA: hypothetical protein VL048_21195 [Xanthobacteraceae bacterium]|nr:hypothetical protein [Xanthobacteraceae bacterium]